MSLRDIKISLNYATGYKWNILTIYIYWILLVACAALVWIFTKDNWKPKQLLSSLHGNTAQQHTITGMTSLCLQNTWEKNRKQSIKCLIHWGQYMKMSLLKIDVTVLVFLFYLTIPKWNQDSSTLVCDIEVICLALWQL